MFPLFAGTISYIPALFGLHIAAHIIREVADGQNYKGPARGEAAAAEAAAGMRGRSSNSSSGGSSSGGGKRSRSKQRASERGPRGILISVGAQQQELVTSGRGTDGAAFSSTNNGSVGMDSSDSGSGSSSSSSTITSSAHTTSSSLDAAEGSESGSGGQGLQGGLSLPAQRGVAARLYASHEHAQGAGMGLDGSGI